MNRLFSLICKTLSFNKYILILALYRCLNINTVLNVFPGVEFVNNKYVLY